MNLVGGHSGKALSLGLQYTINSKSSAMYIKTQSEPWRARGK